MQNSCVMSEYDDSRRSAGYVWKQRIKTQRRLMSHCNQTLLCGSADSPTRLSPALQKEPRKGFPAKKFPSDDEAVGSVDDDSTRPRTPSMKELRRCRGWLSKLSAMDEIAWTAQDAYAWSHTATANHSTRLHHPPNPRGFGTKQGTRD
jgi:hypothetical protein